MHPLQGALWIVEPGRIDEASELLGMTTAVFVALTSPKKLR
jgi:hypothetical protein